MEELRKIFLRKNTALNLINRMVLRWARRRRKKNESIREQQEQRSSGEPVFEQQPPQAIIKVEQAIGQSVGSAELESIQQDGVSDASDDASDAGEPGTNDF
jgi:hypothetical protein